MTNIPNSLVTEVSNDEQQKVNEWWNSLSEENQKEIVTLCGEKIELCRISSNNQSKTKPKKSTRLKIIGKFEDRQNLNSNEEWFEDLYEYLVSHPEALILIEQFETKTFHICTSHEKAREVLKNGFIPADFGCPFESNECPMRKILEQKPDKSLKFLAVSLPE